MTRIDDTFARLRGSHRTGLVTFTAAGDPDLGRSGDILEALERAGADILEVGVPFSDPLADGPVIQRAHERALAAGGSLPAVLDLVGARRRALSAPIVLFTYANPVVRMGFDEFARRAARVGVDGVLVVDLPIEEAAPFQAVMSTVGIDTIFLLSPTTTDERLKKAAALARGFLYGISRLGVTGARQVLSDDARLLVERIRRHTAVPVAVGFGLSKPVHRASVGQGADAAVIGSALVEVIARAGDDLIERVETYVRWVKGERMGRGEAPVA